MEQQAGPEETLESRCFRQWCEKMMFLVSTRFWQRTCAIFWDLLMYTTDHYGFSVQGEKVFRGLEKSLEYFGQANHLNT